MSDTDLLYLADSYAREFSARVIALEDHAVLLNRTAFYPRGGGQMCDRGYLEADGVRLPVIAVEKRGQNVLHILAMSAPALGTEVIGRIDWDFRYQMMRTHSALHVLCGVIYHEYGAQVTGCQMYPDRARMDFTLDHLTPERIERIGALTNQAIRSGYPIRARTMPRREANLVPELIRTKINLVPVHVDPVRVVEIVGLDMQADGGTHVANTLEISGIDITKTENKGRENRRLEIVLWPLSH